MIWSAYSLWPSFHLKMKMINDKTTVIIYCYLCASEILTKHCTQCFSSAKPSARPVHLWSCLAQQPSKTATKKKIERNHYAVPQKGHHIVLSVCIYIVLWLIEGTEGENRVSLKKAGDELVERLLFWQELNVCKSFFFLNGDMFKFCFF